jgi:hypothetical protein
MVKMIPALSQAVVSFCTHDIACQFMQVMTVAPFSVAVKRLLYVFQVTWYVVPSMFVGSLPVVPIMPATAPLHPQQRMFDMQLQLNALCARVAKLEGEVEQWRQVCEQLEEARLSDEVGLCVLIQDGEALDVAQVKAALSPRSLYSQDELECFLKECLP